MTSDNDVYRWLADVIVYRTFGPFIACLGIVGGTLSLLVFRRKSLRKKSCSIYFLFLALADLLCMVCWLIHFVLPTYNIHLLTMSNFSCKLFVFAMYFAFDLANYLLTVCRQFCHRRMAYSITLALVLVHTLFNGHLLYGFVVLSARAEDGTSTPVCIQRLDSERYEKFFNIYDSYVDVIRTNVIPFVIMSICNIIIINRVCRSNALRNATNKTRARTNKARKKFEKDRQLTLMLLGSSIAFLLLTLPTEISDIIRSHSGGKLVTTKTYLLAAILLSLAHLNYAVHFYIYTLNGEVFRQQLLKLWLIKIGWPLLSKIFSCKRMPKGMSTDLSTQNLRMEVSLATNKFNEVSVSGF